MLRRKTIGRAIAVLAIGGVLAASFAISPSFSAIKKAKVKKIATKQANNVVNAVSNAYYTHSDGPLQGGNNSGFDLDASDSIVQSLSLPAGRYIVTSTFSVTRDNNGLTMICELRAGGAVDAYGGFSAAAGQINEGTALSVAASLSVPGTAELRCDDGSVSTTDSDLSEVDIAAIEVANLNIS